MQYGNKIINYQAHTCWELVSLIRREQLDTKEGWHAFVLRLERAQTEHAKTSGFALAEWLHDEAIRGIDLQFYELRCLELNGLEVCGFKVKAPFSIIFCSSSGSISGWDKG